MKLNTTSIVLLAAAAAGGYYFYTKNKSAKSAASKVTVEEDKEEEETPEENKPNSYGSGSGYGTSPAYATASAPSSAPSLVTASTSAPKQKLTIIKKLATGKTKFTDLIVKAAAKNKANKLKRIAKRRMSVKKKVSGFDNCIGLY